MLLILIFCAWNNANAWQFFVPQFMFKKARQNNNNMSFLFFLYISWSHRKCLRLLWKGKVYKNYGWRQNVFILHVLKTLLISKNVIILWGGTGELQAVKNVVALYRIYILHKLYYSLEGCCNSTAAAPVVVLSSVFEWKFLLLTKMHRVVMILI